MDNSSSLKVYGCSTSQEIPLLLENLKGDDNYKRLHKKCEHNIHCINIPTKLSVYFVRDYDAQKTPPPTRTMCLTKTVQSFHPISFKC